MVLRFYQKSNIKKDLLLNVKNPRPRNKFIEILGFLRYIRDYYAKKLDSIMAISSSLIYQHFAQNIFKYDTIWWKNYRN